MGDSSSSSSSSSSNNNSDNNNGDNNSSSKKENEHKFWMTQPVPQSNSTREETEENGPIEATKTVADVRPTPYPLPAGFEWTEFDIEKTSDKNDMYSLLNENYVEDDENMFRFDYSIPFLNWALMPPGYKKIWHVGVRVSTSKRLVGFITAIPATMNIHGKAVKLVEINFLCVHKKLRAKRLAPVLIKEVTRRVHTQNIWQAVYTAGIEIPSPIGCCRYYHRSLNPKKLIEVEFSHLNKRMTLSRTIKLYKLPDKPVIEGIRPLQPQDCEQVRTLLCEYLKKFKLHPEFDAEEFRHWFLPIDGVINSYVVESPSQPGKITDFISFYTLPSTIIGNEKHKVLKAAYSFYNVPGAHTLIEIMNDALILAKQLDFDVFNCLNLMENDSFIKELKFGIGDGNLHYYVYNWMSKSVTSSDVGLVLL